MRAVKDSHTGAGGIGYSIVFTALSVVALGELSPQLVFFWTVRGRAAEQERHGLRRLGRFFKGRTGWHIRQERDGQDRRHIRPDIVACSSSRGDHALTDRMDLDYLMVAVLPSWPSSPILVGAWMPGTR